MARTQQDPVSAVFPRQSAPARKWSHSHRNKTPGFSVVRIRMSSVWECRSNLSWQWRWHCAKAKMKIASCWMTLLLWKWSRDRTQASWRRGREDSRKKGRTRDVIAKRSQKCLQKCGQTKGQTQGQTSKFEVTMWNRFVLDRAWEKRGETTVCSPVLRSQQEEIRHSMSVEENSKNIEIPKFPLSPR